MSRQRPRRKESGQVKEEKQSQGTQKDMITCSYPVSPKSHHEWWHRSPSFSSSVVLFSSCLQSFSASRSFPISCLFTSGGQSIRASASASVLPMNIQSWFPLGLTDFISLQSYGVSRVFSSTAIQKHQFFGTQPSLWSNSHIHTWLLKSHSFDYRDFCRKVLSLLFNTLSRLVIAFLSWIGGFISNTISQWQITHKLHTHLLSLYASAHFKIQYSLIYFWLL